MSGLALIYLFAWSVFSVFLFGFTILRRHPYRFPRFVVFESLLSLIFLNARVWFQDPFSIRQILSWICLLGSIILALHGFFLLKTRGNPEGDFEDTTTLITTGAYQFIRHPLYTSLVLFGLGAFLKQVSWLGLLLLAAAVLGVVFTARIEEEHNLERFGDIYLQYREKTKRFIPFVF
jgi:protein-S-isoprenylcysteine O-methyltransferase Ste14